MKLLRILFSVAVLVIIVCAIALGALMIFINPNKLKPVIAESVKNQTGYNLLMEGDFSWSFYPRIGISVDHIALSVPGQSKPFLDLHHVTFVTELAELLHGNQKLRGDIDISNMKLLNLQAQQVHLGLHWQDQVLTLQPITANLYQGTLVGSAHGSHLSENPYWDWDIQTSDVQLHPFFQDVYGQDAKVYFSGLGKIKLRAWTQGNTRDQILNHLNGSSEFSLANGEINGIDLNYLIQSADALINKQPLIAPSTLDQTHFDSFNGTATIKNGIVSTNEVILRSPAMIASGAGSIDLILEAINMQLHVTPQKEAQNHWVIPVMIIGNLYRPDARLDVTELNIMIAKDKIEKIKNTIEQKMKEHFSGKTNKFFKKMIGK